MGLYNANGNKDEGSRVFFEACNTPSAISHIASTVQSDKGIFTISGRRITKISRPGVYTINGKKRIIRSSVFYKKRKESCCNTTGFFSLFSFFNSILHLLKFP